MGTALLVAAALPAFAVALLAVPVTVAFSINRIAETEGELSLRWLFGLVRFQVGIPGEKKPKGSPGTKPASPKKRRRGGTARDAFALLRDADLRSRAVRLVQDVLRTIHGRDLFLRLRVGLGDPAETGRLWAVLGPLGAMASRIRCADVRIEPEFVDPALEVESRGELRLVPLRLGMLALVFLLSPATIKALLILRRRTA